MASSVNSRSSFAGRRVMDGRRRGGAAERSGDSTPARPGSASHAVARLSRGLGYFSLALGGAQLAAPSAVNELIGVSDDPRSRFWQRLLGAQELAAAAGILAQRRPVAWLWGRTSGDLAHLGMLARAYRSRRRAAPRLAFAITSVLGCLAADAFASVRMSTDPQLVKEGRKMNRRASITIRASREELAAHWRSFEQDKGGPARLGPIEILGETPSGLEWRTSSGASARANGTTRFRQAPEDRGCEIHVETEFEVPGGALGEVADKVRGEEPLQLVRDDLRRLKQLVETGEIARSDGAPGGSSAKAQPKQRPAQPLEHVNV